MIDADSLSPFSPVQGVIIYKRHSDYYLETHDILQQETGYQWQEGKPLAKEHLTKLVLSLGDKTFTPMKINGLMPKRLLYFQQSFTSLTMIWWLKPSEQELHFVKALKLPSGKMKLPGMVFFASGNNLNVYAVKGTAKPTIATPLFRAPFHNTGPTGNVCMGNTKDNKRRDEVSEEMKRWERRFFNSYFTHLNDDGILAPGYNIQLLYKDLLQNGQPFPEEALAPSPHKTLKHLLKVIRR